MSEWFNHGNSSKQKKFHLFPKKFIFGQIFFASLHPTQNLMVILQNICIQNLSGMQLTNLILKFPNFILFVPIVTWTLSNYHFPMFYPCHPELLPADRYFLLLQAALLGEVEDAEIGVPEDHYLLYISYSLFTNHY